MKLAQAREKENLMMHLIVKNPELEVTFKGELFLVDYKVMVVAHSIDNIECDTPDYDIYKYNADADNAFLMPYPSYEHDTEFISVVEGFIEEDSVNKFYELI